MKRATLAPTREKIFAAAAADEETVAEDHRRHRREACVKRLLIAGPETLKIDTAVDLKHAIEDAGGAAAIFRQDGLAPYSDFQALVCERTHLLLAIDSHERYETLMLITAERAGIQRIGFICLGGRKALERHKRRIEEGNVFLIIVGSEDDVAAVTKKWPHQMVLCFAPADVAHFVVHGLTPR